MNIFLYRQLAVKYSSIVSIHKTSTDSSWTPIRSQPPDADHVFKARSITITSKREITKENINLSRFYSWISYILSTLTATIAQSFMINSSWQRSIEVSSDSNSLARYPTVITFTRLRAGDPGRERNVRRSYPEKKKYPTAYRVTCTTRGSLSSERIPPDETRSRMSFLSAALLSLRLCPILRSIAASLSSWRFARSTSLNWILLWESWSPVSCSFTDESTGR